MLSRLIFAGLAATLPLCAQQDTSAHPGHSAAVNRHGDHVMRFSHEKTTHHFRLYPDGGAIEVTANDPNDVESAHRFGCTYRISPVGSLPATSMRRCSSTAGSRRAFLR